MEQIQQGDVVLKFGHLDTIPDGAKAVTRNHRGFVLAEGEATGHAHVISDGVEVFEKEGTLYIRSEQFVQVTHEEHKPVTLEPGIYEVGRVREYCPFTEEARQVSD